MRHLCGICAAKDKTDLAVLHGNAVTLHLRGFYVITKVKTNLSFLQILVVDCCPEWEWMTRLRNLHGIAVILQRILRGKGQTSNSIFLIVWDGLNTSRIWRNPDVISTVYISRFALRQRCSNGAVWMIDCSNREIWNYICGKYQITFVRNMKLYLWNYQKNGAVWMIDCSKNEIWNYICDKYQSACRNLIMPILCQQFWTHALTFNSNSGYNPIPLLKCTILHSLREIKK